MPSKREGQLPGQSYPTGSYRPIVGSLERDGDPFLHPPQAEDVNLPGGDDVPPDGPTVTDIPDPGEPEGRKITFIEEDGSERSIVFIDEEKT